MIKKHDLKCSKKDWLRSKKIINYLTKPILNPGLEESFIKKWI